MTTPTDGNENAMTKDEVVLHVSRLLDKAHWEPLRAVLPIEECAGFMWMESTVDLGIDLALDMEEHVFHVYKHGITRNTLVIDAETHGCWFHGDTGDPDIGEVFFQVESSEALDAAFDGLERGGWTRQTAYDDEFRAKRAAALRDQGITTVY